jgi:hypothetical protein
MSVERDDGPVCFRASNPNTGPVMLGGRVVDLKRNGKPLQAGDLIAGDFYEFDLKTGEVKAAETRGQTACPHGHRDWDDCPDCRH